MKDHDRELGRAIAALEAQRAILGDAVVETALGSLRQRLAELQQAERWPVLILEGEHKLVTIMFADIAGFTALAETMGPESVRDLINACFDRMVPIVERYEGTVDKFIGDEVMVLFGAPVTHEDDPERALRAALEIKAAIAAFNVEHGTSLSVHFGIDTGLVIAGGMGSSGRQQYSVVGDAVNRAKRLEEVSEQDEILVGPDTYRLTVLLFEFDVLEPVRVKGRTELVSVYRLLAPRDVSGKGRGIAGLESPLVGRQVELQALLEAIGRLRIRVGGIVTLVARAGLGKSRLVAETRSQVIATSLSSRSALPLQWVEGHCSSYGISSAYLLWLNVLRGLLGVTPEDPPIVARDKLQRQIRSLCPRRFAAVYPYLGWLMSLPLAAADEATVHAQEGASLKRNTFRAIETLMAAAAWQRPLVIVCEDLHWADPTSIELLEHLLPLTNYAPLLFICAFRPYTEHGCWRIREIVAWRYRHTDLHLDPLSAGESEMLVSNLLSPSARENRQKPMRESTPSDSTTRPSTPRSETESLPEGLPPQLRERILNRAEGNPFYVEEVIRSLIDSGTIVQDEVTGLWHATRDVATIDIPDTLRGVIMARIDQLPKDTKRVLQLASIIGRIFSHRVLAAIAETVPFADGERDLDDHLLFLQLEEMIRRRARATELEYVFKHHLTREVAYDGLLKREQRFFHRQVAEALERLFPDRIEEQVGLLAHHWEQAQEVAKAAEYLLRAGDQSRVAYAHQESIDYYRRALAFLQAQGEHERAARTLMKLGLTYHTAFDFRHARESYEKGFAQWQQAGKMKIQKEALPPAPHALRVPVPREPLTLDPTSVSDRFSENVVWQLFSGLVDLRPDLGIVPDVAHSWDVSADGRRYIFHLRDDVRWSDGTPVTAGDFEYAWRRVLAPRSATESAHASQLYDVRGARAYQWGERDVEDLGVQALDDITLEVYLEEPTSYFLHLLACTVCYPVPRHVVEVHGEAWTEVENIVTNGPFKLVDWHRGQSMTLERNPLYHGRFEGNVQHVEGSFLTEWTAVSEMYKADKLDILDLPSSELIGARQQSAGEYVSIPLSITFHVGFDTSRPPFDDVRVRRAFALAIDRETWADVVMRGSVFPATGGFVPSGMPGHAAGIALPYDPEQARQLLAAAGYSDGRDFPTINAYSLIPGGLPELRDEYLGTQWRENLGVETMWETMDKAKKFLDRADEAPPHLLRVGWLGDYPDPSVFLGVAVHESRRWIHWQNPAYDRLVAQARRVTDQGERMNLYRQADRILVEEAAIVPLAYGQLHLLVKPWVRRYPISALKSWFWKDVVIEPH